MRNVSVRFHEEKDREANRPIELYQVFLDEDTLYLACYNADVTFFNEKGQPEIYYAIGIGRSAIRMNMDNQVDECTVGIDNVNREMSAYIANTEFRGRRLRILKVMLDALDSPNNAVVLFDGLMDSPTIDEHSLRVRVVSQLNSLTIAAPRRKYQTQCNWQFGSPECGVDLEAQTRTGTVSAQSADGKTFTLSGRNEEKDYYVEGVLIIGKHSQKIVSSNGPTVVVEYPFPLGQAGKPYQIRRGCGKTKEECQKYNNFARYGGFLSVPSNQIRL